jgi:hypothetical protein
MGKPDALSIQANHRSGQGDNDNLTLLTLELFQIRVRSATFSKRFSTVSKTMCKRNQW